MVDEATKKTLVAIPLLRTNAGPRDGDQWATRLKEEYISLIKVTTDAVNKFTLYIMSCSMLARTRSLITTGSDWNRPKMERGGLGSVGMCTTS